MECPISDVTFAVPRDSRGAGGGPRSGRSRSTSSPAHFWWFATLGQRFLPSRARARALPFSRSRSRFVLLHVSTFSPCQYTYVHTYWSTTHCITGGPETESLDSRIPRRIARRALPSDCKPVHISTFTIVRWLRIQQLSRDTLDIAERQFVQRITV